jgi:hypothetical protein
VIPDISEPYRPPGPVTRIVLIVKELGTMPGAWKAGVPAIPVNLVSSFIKLRQLIK